MAGFAETPENPSEPPHFKPMHNFAKEAGARCALLAATRPEKVCRIATGNHSSFRAAALLLEDEQGLVKIGIALLNLRPQNSDLRVLAAQAEDCGSSGIGMVNVAGDQPAEILGVFPGFAAAALMKQESDSVEILEKAVTRAGIFLGEQGLGGDLLGRALPVRACQLSDLTVVTLGWRESQFFL
jgi:hypothetical protein